MKLKVPFFHKSAGSSPKSPRSSSMPPAASGSRCTVTCGSGLSGKKASARRRHSPVQPPPQLKRLSSHAVRELEEVFNVFDANKDGKISAGELGAVLRSLGDDPTPVELQQMVKDVDTDGDGFINLEEFLLLHSSSEGNMINNIALRDAFLFFDADKNGYISAQELNKALERLGRRSSVEDCQKMIEGVDIDRDGQVSFEEFQRMMAW